MKVKPLMTHEIGSLAKPAWRVKAMSGKPLDDADIQEAAAWGEKLQIKGCESLVGMLKKKKGFSAEEKSAILQFSSQYGTRLLESAGLDLVWDGEQHRVEMYEYPVRHMQGFRFHGHVRSFENKYYRKASCEEVPTCHYPYHLEEYLTIKALAKREVKIPVTGAYTLVDWSYDSHYISALVPGIEEIDVRRIAARKSFLRDISKNVIYPNLKSLYEAGARFLQIDEPAATTKRDETELYLQSMEESIGDLAGKVFFSVHICFSHYARLFPAIRRLEGILNEIHFEYANRDSRDLGVTRTVRRGYEMLEQLKETEFVVGLGVVDIHTDYIEPPELIRDRILYACKIMGDPGRIMVAPDCGLRTRSWEVALQKLKNMVKGKQLAARELGIIAH